MRATWTIVAAVTAGLVAGTASPATASCPPPYLQVVPATVAPGGTLTLTGAGWASACVGTVVDPMASSPPSPPPPAAPDTVVITFAQGAESVVVGTVTAGDDYGFTTSVQVPASARAGAGTITAQAQKARSVASAELTITAARPQPAEALPRTGPRLQLLALAAVGVALLLSGFTTAVLARPPGRHARRR